MFDLLFLRRNGADAWCLYVSWFFGVDVLYVSSVTAQ